MSQFDTEEQAILEAFEADELKRPADAAATQKRHQAYAATMFRKDARINVRLPAQDLRRLKQKALADGLPYQSLVASVLHKYVEGRLHETD